jgi:putative membrane protein
MMYGWDGWGWGGWIVMTVLMVVFWAVVITAIVLAIRYASAGGQRTQGGSSTKTAEDVLAERFARGEIDDEEYRRRMSLLREHRTA